MDVNSVFGGESLKAADLQGREVPVTIATVEQKKFDNGNKLVIRFAGKKKALICNKTNAKRIASIYGADTNAWIGQQIVLVTDFVEFQGETVPAIRVKYMAPVVPAAAAVPLRPAAAAARIDRDPMPDQTQQMDDEIPF